MRHLLHPVAMLAALSPPALAGAPLRQLTDADLAAYAAKPFDKAAMMFSRVALGLHHGAPVVADFPCADVCPAYTTRIVHYDLQPGPACARVGGVTETRSVPQGIAAADESFCVPAVLATQK